MKFRRTAAMLLACVMALLALSACGAEPVSGDEAPSEAQTGTQTPQEEQVQEEPPTEAYQPAPIDVSTLSIPEIPRVSAQALAEAAPVESSALSVQEDRPVLFIADGGTGDGSSAAAALGAQRSDNVIASVAQPEGFYDSVLYQAVARLYGTGGTIVICGEVLCDRDRARGEEGNYDLMLPHIGSADITFTSVWDGVDYRETNGARLILQSPVNLMLNNAVTFRDMDICTQDGDGYSAANRVIAGCGFETVVDTGVQCYQIDRSGQRVEAPSADAYPSIVGGQRVVNLERSTELTLRSGTFYTVCAGSMGIGLPGFGEVYGSSHLVIEGDTVVTGLISGTTNDARGIQDGDVLIELRGGSFHGKIQLFSSAGFRGKSAHAVLRITGGEFSSGVKLMAKVGNLYKNKPAYTLLDVSACGADAQALAAQAVGFSAIAPGQAAEASIQTPPRRSVYFTGDQFDPTGLCLLLDGQALAWEQSLSGFSFRLADGTQVGPGAQPLPADASEIEIYYQDTLAGTAAIQVLPRPQIGILGVLLDAEAERQTLGFAFGIEDADADGLTIESCGVRMLPESMVRSDADLYLEKAVAKEFLWEEGSAVPQTMLGAGGLAPNALYAALTDIPVEEYGTTYCAAAFYTFIYNGVRYTAVSPVVRTSVYAAAQQLPGAEHVVSLAESGAGSTRDEQLVQEKIEQMISYMESMAKQAWTSPEDINFAGSSSVTGALHYLPGETYYGLPYIGGYNGMDNLESFQRTLDADGVYTGATTWGAMHGNNCTSAIFQSISRVTSSYDYWAWLGDPLVNIIPKAEGTKGPAVRVGDYEIRPSSALSTVIVSDNADTQRIYEAYAAAQRGDYLYCQWIGGNERLSHLRLITDVCVTRNADGTIDPYLSYLLVDEQTSTMDAAAHTTWGVNRAFTFMQLCSEAYLPSRDTAFATGYFETPWCAVYDVNTPWDLSEGLRGTVVSNYDLSEVCVKITDAETGETVFEAAEYGYFNRRCSLSALDPEGKTAQLTGAFQYSLTVTTANETTELVRFEFAQ